MSSLGRGAGWAGSLTEAAKLTASDGAANDSFGSAVAISGDTVVVGAHYATVSGHIGQGAAYVFNTPQSPTLQLFLNASAFHPGEVLKLEAVVIPGLSPVNADVYVAVQLPGGGLLFFLGGTSFTTTLQPIVSNWTIASFNGTIFFHTFDAKEPVGNYKWLGAFTEPGTLNFIGPIVSAPFTFGP